MVYSRLRSRGRESQEFSYLFRGADIVAPNVTKTNLPQEQLAGEGMSKVVTDGTASR